MRGKTYRRVVGDYSQFPDDIAKQQAVWALRQRADRALQFGAIAWLAKKTGYREFSLCRAALFASRTPEPLIRYANEKMDLFKLSSMPISEDEKFLRRMGY